MGASMGMNNTMDDNNSRETMNNTVNTTLSSSAGCTTTSSDNASFTAKNNKGIIFGLFTSVSAAQSVNAKCILSQELATNLTIQQQIINKNIAAAAQAAPPYLTASFQINNTANINNSKLNETLNENTSMSTVSNCQTTSNNSASANFTDNSGIVVEGIMTISANQNAVSNCMISQFETATTNVKQLTKNFNKTTNPDPSDSWETYLAAGIIIFGILIALVVFYFIAKFFGRKIRKSKTEDDENKEGAEENDEQTDEKDEKDEKVDTNT